MELARAFERSVESMVHWSITHRKAVLSIAVVLTLLLVPGIFRLEVHNRMTDWVDPDDPDAGAFIEATQDLPGMVDFGRTLLEYQGEHSDALLSPDSLREQERLIDDVLQRVPGSRAVLAPVQAVQIAQYEMERARGDPDPEARLPASDEELQLAIDGARSTQSGILDYTLTPDLRFGIVGFGFSEAPFSKAASDKGGEISDAVVAAYDDGDYRTLTGEHRETVGVGSVTDHVNDILTEDILILGGLGIGLVFFLFLLAAGRPAAVMGGFSSLALGLLWTVGALGWLGLPFNLLNFAILPLVMGNGIDYSIHVLAEARGHKRGFGTGLGRHLGKTLGVPIVLVTLTTCIGLSSLAWSRSPYLQQMGLIAAGSIFLIGILSLTFIPAFLATFARGTAAPKTPRTGRLFVAVGMFARRRPAILWTFVVVASMAGLVGLLTMDYRVDVFQESLPDDDPLIRNEEAYEEAFGNTDVWFLVLQGDVVTEESFAFQDRFRDRLLDEGIVSKAGDTFDLPTLAGAHAQARTPVGPLLPIVGIPSPGPTPAPHEQVEAMQQEAPYADMVALLYDGEDTGTFYILPPPEADDAATTDDLRHRLQGAVAASEPPDGLDVHVYGFKLLSRDFMDESQDSLRILYAVTLGSTLILFYSVTRDVRATLLVAAPVLVSSLWWFGLLRLFVGAIDVYQLISLVFITSIGSDYAAYLIYKYSETGDWKGTLSTTGRAVLFSAVTDAGAFFVFSLTRVRSGGDMLLGAGLAIVAIFVATLLIVPGLLPSLKSRSRGTPR